jgi:hypothetical protein
MVLRATAARSGHSGPLPLALSIAPLFATGETQRLASAGAATPHEVRPAAFAVA